MLKRLACGALMLTLAACASGGGVKLEAPMPGDPPVLRVSGAGEGAHPAVLIVPGCEAPLLSSRAAFYTRLAEKLNKDGFTTAILAYPGSGLGSPVCQQVTDPKAMAMMIAGALAQLRADQRVDPRRLHLAGWAWGGRGVLEVIMQPQRSDGLVSAATFYPPCPAPVPWKSEVTSQVFTGERDTVSAHAVCKAWAEKSDGPGPVVITRYVGVGHGFDIDEAGSDTFAAWQTGTPLTFDRSTAWQAYIDLVAFLRLPISAP